MEILQLRYFFDSAVTENFAKTAEKYNVPTTSVSASVKRLENELGCKLFDRFSNKIMLNDNGRQLKKSLNVVFGELDRAVEILTDTANDNREIKVLVQAHRSKAMDYIIEYKLKYPNTKVKLIFDFDKKDFENYDIIIAKHTEKLSNYEHFTLSDARVCIKASKNHPLLGEKLTLKQLSSQNFVSMNEHSNMHKILVEACGKAGFSPNIVAYCNDIHCYSKCISSGIGIGLGREYSNGEKSGRILNVTDFNVRYKTCVFYKTENLYGAVESFIKFLKNKSV